MQIFAASFALVAALTSGVAAQSNSTHAASNFTYQVNWPANIKVLPSVAYSTPKFDLSTLPKFSWSLLNESQAFRNTLCTQQMAFCDKAGCDAAPGVNAEDAKVHDNWCNPSTMATKCTCVGGTSRLQQYQWPVQSQDCRMRGQACQDQCRYGGTLTADMASCVSNCESTFGMNCGMAGQISANYAVMSKKDTPSLTMMQGGDSQSPAALNAKTSVVLVAGVAIVASLSSLL